MGTVNVGNIVISEGIPGICVPIIGRIEEELLSEVEMLKSVPVDVVEWRTDWFEEVEYCERAVAMLQVLCEAIPEMPIPATSRSKEEGGELEINTAAYVELNKAIIDSRNADLIGVGLFTREVQVKELIAHTRNKSVRVIISNHDFDKTPSYNEILIRLKAVQTLGADIPEVAVMPTCKVDITALLRATNSMHENFTDRPIIIMPMTSTGVLSGLCREVSDSALTFDATKKTSAPGQIGVEGLKTVLSLLHKGL